MHPILFRIGNFPVGTYGLILMIGFLVSLSLAQRLGRRDGIPGESLSDLAITLLLAGILGAKVLMIIVDVAGGKPLSEIFDMGYMRAGGAIHGGVIGGVLAFFWRVKKLKLPLAKTLDALTPAVALGQGIGRIGCFMAGCCYGSACDLPWKVHFTNPDARWVSGTPEGWLHPVQLYTMAANFAILGLLLFARGRQRFAGQVAALYFMLEGVGRMVTEIWRDDADRGFLLNIKWLSTGRATGIIFVLFGIILWYVFARTRREEVTA